MSQCVFCNAVENLNTQFTITLDDGSKVNVKICDTHAEEATVRSAREAFVSKRKQLDDLLAQAKALGYSLTETTQSGLMIPQAPQRQEPRQNQMVLQEPQLPQNQGIIEGNIRPQYVNGIAPPSQLPMTGPDVVPTDKLDKRDFVSVGGVAGAHSVASHKQFRTSDLKDQLDPAALQGQAKLSVVEGRGGQPLVIPEKRVDGTGTTRITVKKSDDAQLQNRFKKLAKNSIEDRVDMARNGYTDTQRTCPLCRGNCTLPNSDTICPKCQGSGVISIY